MNSITLTGRLTQDPQKRSAGEIETCDMRLAVQRRRGRDGDDRGAVFVDITSFQGLAGICGQYLSKGSRVGVQGRLELDEWEAEDGSPRRRHKVIADQVEFLDTPGQQNDEAASEPQAQDKPQSKRRSGAKSKSS